MNVTWSNSCGSTSPQYKYKNHCLQLLGKIVFPFPKPFPCRLYYFLEDFLNELGFWGSIDQFPYYFAFISFRILSIFFSGSDVLSSLLLDFKEYSQVANTDQEYAEMHYGYIFCDHARSCCKRIENVFSSRNRYRDHRVLINSSVLWKELSLISKKEEEYLRITTTW